MRLFAGTPFDRPPRCETCGKLEAECTCPAPDPVRVPPEKQTARIAVEKRKNGRQVTVVRGLTPQGTDLIQLLSTLKMACGAGGTLKEDEIEIQGNQLDRVRSQLQAIGFRVKG
jgi:translation initiation factor 1